MNNQREQEIRAFADEAEGLLAEYKPPHHIWTAIRHVPEDDRKEMFRDVQAELRRRKEEDAEMDAEKQRRFMEGARANELRQRRTLGKDF
jgi:hypothetical protein